MGTPAWDLGSRMVEAFHAGAQEKRLAEQLAQEKEFRNVQMQGLKNEQARLKHQQDISDFLERYKLRSGQPAEILPGTKGPEMTSSNLPGGMPIPAQIQPTALPQSPLPVPESLGGGTITPLTAEQLNAIDFSRKRAEALAAIHEIPKGGALASGAGGIIAKNPEPTFTIPTGMPGAGASVPETIAGAAMRAAATVTSKEQPIAGRDTPLSPEVEAQRIRIAQGGKESNLNPDTLAAYASDISEGRTTLDKIPVKDRGAVRSFMVEKGMQVPAPLSGAAQTVLMQTQPVMDQVHGLLQIFEPMKEDNTPFKFFPEALKYKAGIASPIGSAQDAIANLNMLRIVGAARLLKGSSRAIQALMMAAQHTPNIWKDSPKLIYEKLSNLRDRLTEVETAANSYGNKYGVESKPSNTGKPTTAEEYLQSIGQ